MSSRVAAMRRFCSRSVGSTASGAITFVVTVVIVLVSIVFISFKLEYSFSLPPSQGQSPRLYAALTLDAYQQ
jgi:hypothetical protein